MDRCLHLAASEGNGAIVEYLIGANASVSAEDRWRSTPLRDALREGHRKVVAILHAAGATLGRGGEFSLSQMDAELREMFERCEHAGKARGGGGAPTKATLCAVLEEAPVIRPDL